MKLLRLLCAGMLIVGMQVRAAEFTDAASSTSSETDSLSQLSPDSDSESSALSSIPDAPPLNGYKDYTPPALMDTSDKSEALVTSRPTSLVSSESERTTRVSFAPTPEEASSPHTRHLPPPSRIDEIRSFFNNVRTQNIPALRKKPGYRYVDYNNCKIKVQQHITKLKGYVESATHTALITEGEQLIRDLDAINLKRNGEIYKNLPTGYDLELPDEQEFDPADSQEKDAEVTAGSPIVTSTSKDTDAPRRSKLTLFPWILGTATVATIATIIWYFCYKKPAMAAIH